MTEERNGEPEELTDEAAKMQSIRHGSASAWMEITGNQTIPVVVDALLDVPPAKEFNKTELADAAGTSAESIRTHIDTLLQFQIVEEIPETSPTRYRLDTDSPVVKRLLQLQGTLNKVGATDEKIEVEREDAASDPSHLQPTFPESPKPDRYNI